VTVATVLRLALAGTRTDTLRVVLTGLSAALATVLLLVAATVAQIQGDPGAAGGTDRYANVHLVDTGMRLGAVLGLVLLSVPVLALAAQCARLGTRARDRRLAAVRLAGATPRQSVLVAVADSGLSALVGAVAGLAVFLLLRVVLHRPHPTGQLPWPTDVPLAVPAGCAVVAGIPLATAAFTALLFRRVIVTPLGVVRRTRFRPPTVWPGLIITTGFVVVAAVEPLAQWIIRTGGSQDLVPARYIWAAVLAVAVLGLVTGTGWTSHTAGRLLHRFGRRPARLIAAQQLRADPWHASRTNAALLAAVVAAACLLAVRSDLYAHFAAVAEARRLSGPDHGASLGADPEWYEGVLRTVAGATAFAVVVATVGVLVAVAEGIASRRHTYAAMVAAGVPRRTLVEALAWRTLAPMLPASVLACTLGVSLTRIVLGSTAAAGGGTSGVCTGTAEQCADHQSAYWTWVTDPLVTRDVPVPLDELAGLTVAVAVVLSAVVGVGALVLRSSTDVEELRTG
jgi:hypothetical protein